MPNLNASLSQLQSGVKISTGMVTTLQIQSATRVRLVDLLFDLNKCFLLPSAMPDIREIRNQYDLHPKSNLLIVGHTDTSGDEEPNLTLSLERSDSIAAFLTDAADAWDAFFHDDKPAEKRWGMREIQMMLSALPEAGERFYAGPIDGVQGDGTTLPSGITPVTHGCGESFPADLSAAALRDPS